MSEILFLAHRVPFPPDRGDKIRSHHVLKALTEIAPVHIATLGETPDDMAQDQHLGSLAASHCLAARDTSNWKAGLKALANGNPVSFEAFRSDALRSYVQDVLRSSPISLIYVFSGQMGQYLPDEFDGSIIVDLVDVDSAKFAQYAFDGHGMRRWIDAREAALLEQAETALANRADKTVLVSEPEAELLRSRLPVGFGANIVAIGNGIDHRFFDPDAAEWSNPYEGEGPHLCFTGQMDYAPNVEAVEHAANAILPRVQERHPHAQFHIVGRAPTARVTVLSKKNGVKVWGAVADMRPFLANADACLVPLRLARGIQNKVLEAMAMRRPVVMTSGAATGIPGVSEEHFLVADEAQDLAELTSDILAQPERARRMGRAARQAVIDKASWPAQLTPLKAFAQNVVASGGSRHAA